MIEFGSSSFEPENQYNYLLNLGRETNSIIALVGIATDIRDNASRFKEYEKAKGIPEAHSIQSLFLSQLKQKIPSLIDQCKTISDINAFPYPFKVFYEVLGKDAKETITGFAQALHQKAIEIKAGEKAGVSKVGEVQEQTQEPMQQIGYCKDIYPAQVYKEIIDYFQKEDEREALGYKIAKAFEDWLFKQYGTEKVVWNEVYGFAHFKTFMETQGAVVRGGLPKKVEGEFEDATKIRLSPEDINEIYAVKGSSFGGIMHVWKEYIEGKDRKTWFLKTFVLPEQSKADQKAKEQEKQQLAEVNKDIKKLEGGHQQEKDEINKLKLDLQTIREEQAKLTAAIQELTAQIAALHQGRQRRLNIAPSPSPSSPRGAGPSESPLTLLEEGVGGVIDLTSEVDKVQSPEVRESEIDIRLDKVPVFKDQGVKLEANGVKDKDIKKALERAVTAFKPILDQLKAKDINIEVKKIHIDKKDKFSLQFEYHVDANNFLKVVIDENAKWSCQWIGQGEVPKQISSFLNSSPSGEFSNFTTGIKLLEGAIKVVNKLKSYNQTPSQGQNRGYKPKSVPSRSRN